jgi:hypothetical protein
MIPECSPRRVLGGNGVRYRVAACRQRLRNSRTTHRALNQSQMDKDPREAGLPLSVHFAERHVTATFSETEEKVGIT